MYYIIDKNTNELLWINKAPLNQDLNDKDIWYLYDKKNHKILKSNFDIIKNNYNFNEDTIIINDNFKNLTNVLKYYKEENNILESKTKEELIDEKLLQPDKPIMNNKNYIFNEKTWQWEEVIEEINKE